MSDEKTLRYLITANGEQAAQQFKKTGDAAKGAGESAKEGSGGFEFLKRGLEALGLIEATKKAVEFGRGLIEAGEKAQQSDDRIGAVAKSMGLFGNSAGAVTDRLSKLADQTAINDGLDANSVKMTEAKLLTFKSLAKSAGETGGMFDKVTQAAINMGAAGFGDAASNAKFLGRAMDDPIKGLTAMTRVGVTFTAQEQKAIKAMVAHGHTSEAQAAILDKLQHKFGGVAEATATSSAKMRASWDVAKEQMGKTLLPMFDKVAGFITGKVIPAVSGFVGGMQDGSGMGGKFAHFLKSELEPPLEKIGNFIETQAIPAVKNFAREFEHGTGPGGKLRRVIDDVGTAIEKTVGFIQRNRSWVEPLVVGLAAFAGAYATVTKATEIYKATQEALNLAMKANTIGIVIEVLVALAAALVYAYNHSATFHRIVDEAFHAVGQAATWMWNNAIAPALRFILNGFADVIDFYAKLLGALGHVPGFGWARDAANMLHGAAQKTHELADGIRNIPNRTVDVNVNFSSNAFQIQQQIQAASRMAAGITFGTVGTTGAGSKARAAGGPVDPGHLYRVGESGTEWFVPNVAGTIVPHNTVRSLAAARTSGGDTYINITVQGDTDPLGAARTIHQKLTQYKRQALGGRSLGL